jgi:Domain of unknown function (DUF4105)
MATGFSLATFATSAGAPKWTIPSVGSSAHTIFHNCDGSTCSSFIGWDRLLPTRIMSFGFEDGRHLNFSIELRRTQDDQYSAVAGFFKTHELVYIGADERDLMTLRKVRNEQIQLDRLGTPPERARALLVEHIEQANDLAARPRFYNTVTTNCTTTIFNMMRAVTSSIPFDWRIILTGHLPGYLYEHGAVDTRVPLEELRRRADVTGRVEAGLSEVEFSSRIRDGVPSPR